VLNVVRYLTADEEWDFSYRGKKGKIKTTKRKEIKSEEI